jgi:hypothetical protein
MASTVADPIVVMFVAPSAKRAYGIVANSLNGPTNTIHRQGKQLRTRQSIRQQSLAPSRCCRIVVMPKTVADQFVKTLVARSFCKPMQRRPK